MQFSEDQMADIRKLCVSHSVKELHIFGSFVTEHFSSESDYDFLVLFQPSEINGRFNRYYHLKDSLEELLGRSVDLLCYDAIRNPYFREEVDEKKVTVYAA
jgi:predicted nucleotidyltransferase